MVHDVDAAIAFYRDRLGFEIQEQFGPNMAVIKRKDLTMWLAGPNASARRPMPDGRKPEPGGWNRIVIQVESIADTVSHLRSHGVPFRSDIITGPGGQQILCEDPSGNCIELFQPA